MSQELLSFSGSAWSQLLLFCAWEVEGLRYRLHLIHTESAMCLSTLVPTGEVPTTLLTVT